MKESKPYPRIDEEDGNMLTTWGELQDCLEEGEKEIERGEYVEWDEFIQQMRLYRHYGS